ncbi:patatin-like phospholipase family protein [Streptomyces sp. NPDC047070]|uniref:patatin-like phospholipase family protein n=1 Tax=Streptomyces sp. NPDC047070 TaxID=3154923 RepID=UPI003455E239
MSSSIIRRILYGSLGVNSRREISQTERTFGEYSLFRRIIAGMLGVPLVSVAPKMEDSSPVGTSLGAGVAREEPDLAEMHDSSGRPYERNNEVDSLSPRLNLVDLVLDGAGIEALPFLGALREVCSTHVVKRVAGTSAGAIVGAFLAAGYSVDELEFEFAAVDYSKFKDGAPRYFGEFGQAVTVLRHGGFYKGDALREWIEDLLARKGVYTFGDLRYVDEGKDPNLPGYRLVVNVSDMSRGWVLRLPWDYEQLCGIDPNRARVADAVRASASAPYIFRPVLLATGLPEGPKRLALVDGSVLSDYRYEVALFDRRDGESIRWPTFGIKLLAGHAPWREWHPTSSSLKVVKRLLFTMSEVSGQQFVADRLVQGRTIFVDTAGILSAGFEIERGQGQLLYSQGREAASLFLDSFDFRASVEERARLASDDDSDGRY